MTTSGTYVLSYTALQLATAIARLLGHAPVDQGDALGAGETATIIEATNLWIFQQKGPPNFMNPGEMMWLREEGSLTLSAKASYDLKPSGGDLAIQIPVSILSVMLKDTDGNETPLVPMELEEYQLLPRKNLTGSPGRYYYEKRIDTGKLNLDYIPNDTTDVLDIVYRQPIEIITAGSETLDFEDWWYRAIKFNAALDVAPEFKSVEPERIELIKQRAAESMALVSSKSKQNDFMYFQPGMD